MAAGEKNAAPAAPYGLVGHPLGHSWSPLIHERLGSAPYALHDHSRQPLSVRTTVHSSCSTFHLMRRRVLGGGRQGYHYPSYRLFLRKLYGLVST